MKTAISIPDSLNESIETFLEKAKMSRSEFFQRAARHYLDRVSARVIRENLDSVYEVRETPTDVAFRRAAVSHLRKVVTDEEE
jgi:metal-responsive CopG/Arc/MetJ family transcriptional regulator